MHYGISAAGALAIHINKNLATSIHHISKLSPIVEEGIMVLDSFTIKNLELFQLCLAFYVRLVALCKQVTV